MIGCPPLYGCSGAATVLLMLTGMEYGGRLCEATSGCGCCPVEGGAATAAVGTV